MYLSDYVNIYDSSPLQPVAAKRKAKNASTQILVSSTPSIVKKEPWVPSSPSRPSQETSVSTAEESQRGWEAKCCAPSNRQENLRGPGATAVVFPNLFALWLLCTYTESKTVSVCSEKIKPKAHSNFLLVESCAWFVSIKPGFCGTTWPIYRAGSSERVEPHLAQDLCLASHSIRRNESSLYCSALEPSPSLSETLSPPTSRMQPSRQMRFRGHHKTTPFYLFIFLTDFLLILTRLLVLTHNSPSAIRTINDAQKLIPAFQQRRFYILNYP